MKIWLRLISCNTACICLGIRVYILLLYCIFVYFRNLGLLWQSRLDNACVCVASWSSFVSCVSVRLSPADFFQLVIFSRETADYRERSKRDKPK